MMRVCSVFVYILASCSLMLSCGISSGSITSTASATTATNVYVNGGNSFSTKGSIGLLDNYDFEVLTSGQPRVTVTSAGNVGIGTTTPTQKLSVVGAIQSTTTGFIFPDSSTQSTAAVQVLAGCIGGSITASTLTYASFSGSSTSFNEANRQIVIPFSSTISNLSLTTTGAQPASGTFTITVRKNSADTALAIVIPVSGAAGTYSDNVNSVSFSAGDTMSIQMNNAASAVTGNVGCYSAKLLIN